MSELDVNLQQRLSLRQRALPAETDAFRWIDFEIPAVTVDLFADVAILSTYRAHSPEQERALAERLARSHPLRAVYLKRRPREARHAGLTQDDLAPPVPLWGEPVEHLIARECGLAFEIRPGNGLSVGLYLDAREARRWIGQNARGKQVLNLFAYTCGFAVAALAGGAARVINLDLSRKVLDWGARNLELNGFEPARPDLVSGDAFGYLERFARKGQRHDLVVLDPPGFATTSESRFSAVRDWWRLIRAAAAVTRPGGRLLLLCNVEAMSAERLEAHIRRALPERRSRILERFGASEVDFQPPHALKCRVVELG